MNTTPEQDMPDVAARMRLLREVLAGQIAEMIRTFERHTGLVVRKLSVERTDVTRHDDTRKITQLDHIDVEVEL